MYSSKSHISYYVFYYVHLVGEFLLCYKYIA